MKVLDRILCSINHHSPMLDRVSWNGLHYCGTCEHCQRPIRRLSRRNWRLVRQVTHPGSD